MKIFPFLFLCLSMAGMAMAHDITLTWTPGDANAATYNVYRGTTAGGEGSTPLTSGVAPSCLAATSIVTCSYVDTSVVGGTTYYYTVTAVEDGVESPSSNEASAKAVVVPRAPAGLKVVAH